MVVLLSFQHLQNSSLPLPQAGNKNNTFPNTLNFDLLFSLDWCVYTVLKDVSLKRRRPALWWEETCE